MIIKKVVFTGMAPEYFKIIDCNAEEKAKTIIIENWGGFGSRHLKKSDVKDIKDISVVRGYFGQMRCCYSEDVEKAKDLILIEVARKATKTLEEAKFALEVVEKARAQS